MQEFFDIALLLALGGLGGLLAGLLGIGGGIIYVLIFSHYLKIYGYNDHELVSAIVANSMFAILFAGLSGSFKQWRIKNFHPTSIIITGIAASISSIFFSYIISTSTWYTKDKFNWLFISLLIFIAFRIFSQRKKPHNIEDKNASQLQLLLTGLCSGTIAAFSGIGGGVIIVPILHDLVKMPIKKATSISLGVISIMALSTSIYNTLMHSNSYTSLPLIQYSLALPVAIGSLIAAPWGVNIANKLNPSQIRIVFLIFIILVILKMLFY